MTSAKHAVLIAGVAIIVWFAPAWARVAAVIAAALTVWLFAARHGVNVSSNDRSPASADSTAELKGLIESLVVATKSECAEGKEELQRTLDLIKAASDKLLASVNNMNRHVQDQREYALRVARTLSEGAQGNEGNLSFSDFILDTSKTLDTFVNNTVSVAASPWLSGIHGNHQQPG